MADSNITKRALAKSLKILMTQKPFNKISVTDICDKCHMNRKSFYYHFKDKSDLLNWIFDTEFGEICQPVLDDGLWDELVALITYIYDNRAFYRKAFRIEGQNSPSLHLYELLYPTIKTRLRQVWEKEDIPDFMINFAADGIICSIKRWISEPNCLPPDVLTEQIHTCIDANNSMKSSIIS